MTPKLGQFYTLSCEDALSFIDESQWPYAAVNPDGEFIWVNTAYCKLLNAPRELIMGTTTQKWTHPEDVAINAELAEKVKAGEIPGYTLSKRYIQRGSTPKKQLVIWGLLSVTGKWETSGSFVGYRVNFLPYTHEEKITLFKVISKFPEVIQLAKSHWKTMIVVLTIVMSLTATGSEKFLNTLRRVLEAKQSVESVLDSSSPGASPQPSLPPSP